MRESRIDRKRNAADLWAADADASAAWVAAACSGVSVYATLTSVPPPADSVQLTSTNPMLEPCAYPFAFASGGEQWKNSRARRVEVEAANLGTRNGGHG